MIFLIAANDQKKKEVLKAKLLKKRLKILQCKEAKRVIRKAKQQTSAEQHEKYEFWVKTVKERDNYTCQICGKCYKGADPRSLQGAHILSKENYPQFMYHIHNGISLCFYHHKNAPISSHLDGFAFSHWLSVNKKEQYEYLINCLKNVNAESKH